MHSYMQDMNTDASGATSGEIIFIIVLFAVCLIMWLVDKSK